MRSESWSYEEQQVDIEEGIAQLEFLLSSVRRERSRNLQSSGHQDRPLLSDIERHIRQLERGQHTLAQVIQGLRDLASKDQYYSYDNRAPLEFQARVEVRHGQSRGQRIPVTSVTTGELALVSEWSE